MLCPTFHILLALASPVSIYYWSRLCGMGPVSTFHILLTLKSLLPPQCPLSSYYWRCSMVEPLSTFYILLFVVGPVPTCHILLTVTNGPSLFLSPTNLFDLSGPCCVCNDLQSILHSVIMSNVFQPYLADLFIALPPFSMCTPRPLWFCHNRVCFQHLGFP